MTLHWGQSHIAACLPEYLLARFNEAYADPNQSPDATTGLPIFNGKTGELLMEMGADRPVRVSRKKMRTLFKEGLDVQFGKAFSGAEMKGEKVEVTFEDGSKAIGDVLVGCDGAKSRVRSTLCGEEAATLTDVPVSMFNFPYKFDAKLAAKIRAINPLFMSAIHPDHGNMSWISSTSPSPSLITHPFPAENHLTPKKFKISPLLPPTTQQHTLSKSSSPSPTHPSPQAPPMRT
jgi:2-polyprenyl-6-methoxyphenol hydroxylase-like FAD-dependent oxidoreductase